MLLGANFSLIGGAKLVPIRQSEVEFAQSLRYMRRDALKTTQRIILRWILKISAVSHLSLSYRYLYI